MNKLEDILNDREKRVALQEELINTYNMPVLTARVNYPGIEKDNVLTRDILQIIHEVLLYMFRTKIYYNLLTFSAEGPISIFVIDKNAIELKKNAVDIENKHRLGRCVDIDVYDTGGTQIGRKDIGMESRKCFICDEDAHSCVRSRKHNIDEIKNYIKMKYDEYMENFYGDIKQDYK
jgi:holo-ACP synthase